MLPRVRAGKEYPGLAGYDESGVRLNGNTTGDRKGNHHDHMLLTYYHQKGLWQEPKDTGAFKGRHPIPIEEFLEVRK